MKLNLLNKSEYISSQKDIAILMMEEETVDINLEQSIEEYINILTVSEKFLGRSNEIEHINTLIDGNIKNIFLVGLGKRELLNEEKLRILCGKLIKKISNLNINDIDIVLPNMDNGSSNYSAIVEGLLLGEYKFDKYKTNKKRPSLDNINIIANVNKEIEDGINEAKVLAEANIIARNLVNEPANIIYPKTLAKEVEILGDKYGFEVEVYDKDQIEELKMDAFLSVAKGSKNSPRLIVMKYFGNVENKDDILGLVGKGLTYDSGGYSLKPTDSMVDMKTDMGGAGTVIGSMVAIAKNKIPVNVIAVVAACENMISGKSYRPGDIIGSMKGLTIEVLNTDAEGRLTLADAVYYAIKEQKVNKIIDVATLTGAALVALGTTTTAVISNNDEFFRTLDNACQQSGEKIWRLPIFDEYKKMIKGNEADLKNTGGRYAGTITAGLFIGEFTEDIPWIHMDIAGTSSTNRDEGYLSKGATGIGVRSLYYLAKGIK